DGGHADLVGHAGQGLVVAEYLVDRRAVDQKILMHRTTPLDDISLVTLASSFRRDDKTGRTGAGAAPRSTNFELSHGPAYALSKFAGEARFDNLLPDWLIDRRRARIMWCSPHVERRSVSIARENEVRGRPFTAPSDKHGPQTP